MSNVTELDYIDYGGITIPSSSAPTPPPIPTLGLQAQYLLATNSNDTSGNAFNGTDANMSYSSNSAVFAGTNSFIATSTSTALDAGSAFTVSVTVVFDSYPSANAWNLAQKVTIGSQGWMIYTDSSQKVYFFGYGTTGTLVGEASTYSLATRYNYICTYDGANLRIYRDNVLVGTQASTGSVIPSANAMNMGYYNNTANSFLNGKLKKVRIYNRVLDASERTQLFTDSGV